MTLKLLSFLLSAKLFCIGWLIKVGVKSTVSYFPRSDIISVDIDNPLAIHTIETDVLVASISCWLENGSEFIQNLPKRNCPSCGTFNQSRQLFKSYDGYEFHECMNCHCWYFPYHLDQAVFENYLSATPEARELLDTYYASRKLASDFQENPDRFVKYFDQANILLGVLEKKRHLDFGCGLGGASHFAKTVWDMEVRGVETSKDCLAICKARELEVVDRIEKVTESNFDYITLFEVIEHVADPAAVLVSLGKKLNSRGLLTLTFPNQNNLEVKLTKGDSSTVFGGYDTPGHINLFSPENIEALANRTGYEVVWIEGQFTSNFLNLLGYWQGKHRGMRDILNKEQAKFQLSKSSFDFVSENWKSFEFIEAETLSSPILICHLCKKGSKQYFTDNLQKLISFKHSENQNFVGLNAPPLALNEKFFDPVLMDNAEVVEMLQHRFTESYDLQVQLNEQKRLVLEYQGIVKDRDNLLGSIQNEVNIRDQTVRKLNAEMREEISKRDQSIANLNAEMREEISKRDQSIANLNAEMQEEITKRDHSIANLNAEMQEEITKRDHSIANLNAEMQEEITKRDHSIANLNVEMQEEITSRDQSIAKLNVEMQEEITSRDQSIAKLNVDMQEEITKRDQSIAKLNVDMQEEISKRDEIISLLNKKINLLT